MAARRPVAAAGLVLAAAAFAVAAGADVGSATGATISAQPQPVDTSRFEAFVAQVGLDVATIPVEMRREWAKSPRIGIDDCANGGGHAEHEHGPDPGEQAVERSEAVGHGSDQ